MFRYNPKANYQPNGDRYLQILSGKDLYKQTIVVSAGTHDGVAQRPWAQRAHGTFPARFPNILSIILWGKCMLGINCGPIGIKLLCDYGKLSWILQCGAHRLLVGLVLHTWIIKNTQWLGRFIVFLFIIMWEEFWKNYRFLCHMRPISMLLIILTPSQIF